MMIIAHRGASSSAPENTLAAFRKAIELGADAVEMDVAWTRDRQIVVFHDDKLRRVTNTPGLLRAHTLAELKRLDAGSFFGPKFAGERIPTLEEVLRLTKRHPMGLFIEMKPGPHLGRGFEQDLVTLLAREQMMMRSYVMSFNHAAVGRVKEIAPQVRTLLLVGRRMRPNKLLKIIHEHNADGISVKASLASKRMAAMLDAGRLMLVVWTVNSRRQMRQLARNGVHAITSDHPARAISVLGKDSRS